MRSALRTALLLHALVPAAVAAEDDPTGRLVARGFENVAVRESPGHVVVWYENRILRDELAAMGVAAGIALESAPADARLELVARNRGIPILSVAADVADWRRFLARAESAEWFRARAEIRAPDAIPERRHAPPAAPGSSPTWRTDLRVRPLFDFELGLTDDPFRSRFRLAPEAVTSPFPGGLLTVQLDAEVHDGLHRSARALAPGRNTLTAAGWLPGGWLATASGGIFAGDRYGLAGEAGRTDASGQFEVRAGGDWSGLLRFAEDVTEYTDLDAWSAFAEAAWRPEPLDARASLTAARFLEGDFGWRAALERRFHEHRVEFFAVRTRVDEVLGVRLRLPLPVREWSRPARFRFTTVPAFPFEYRDTLNEVGQRVSLFDDLDRLRKDLHPGSVRHRLEDVRTPPGSRRPAPRPAHEPTLHGMTGLVNVPTADVLPEGVVRAGASHVPERWAYQGRRTMPNDVYHVTMGFLPWTEVSLRATVLTELSLVPGGAPPAVDRLASAKVRLPRDPGGIRLAAGVDDVSGTRLFHSLYVVGSRTLPLSGPEMDLSVGYGAGALDANVRVLDGWFGGVDVRPVPWGSARLDFDSEKWNCGGSLVVAGRLSLQVVLLHLDTISGGMHWTHRL